MTRAGSTYPPAFTRETYGLRNGWCDYRWCLIDFTGSWFDFRWCLIDFTGRFHLLPFQQLVGACNWLGSTWWLQLAYSKEYLICPSSSNESIILSVEAFVWYGTLTSSDNQGTSSLMRTSVMMSFHKNLFGKSTSY